MHIRGIMGPCFAGLKTSATHLRPTVIKPIHYFELWKSIVIHIEGLENLVSKFVIELTICVIVLCLDGHDYYVVLYLDGHDYYTTW